MIWLQTVIPRPLKNIRGWSGHGAWFSSGFRASSGKWIIFAGPMMGQISRVATVQFPFLCIVVQSLTVLSILARTCNEVLAHAVILSLSFEQISSSLLSAPGLPWDRLQNGKDVIGYRLQIRCILQPEDIHRPVSMAFSPWASVCSGWENVRVGWRVVGRMIGVMWMVGGVDFGGMTPLLGFRQWECFNGESLYSHV